MEYSSDEIKMMYISGSISKDEARIMCGGDGYFDRDDNWHYSREEYNEI